MNKKRNNNLITLTCLALLTAMQIILARYLAIPVTESMRFTTSFIPVVIAARRFGIVGGMAVYGVGDFLGAIIFPAGGAFFPGFTVTAVVSGLIYGLFLSKKGGIVRIVLSVLTSQIVCTLLMNSYWLSMLYGSEFSAIFVSRIPQALIMSVIQILFMTLFLEKISGAIKFRN